MRQALLAAVVLLVACGSEQRPVIDAGQPPDASPFDAAVGVGCSDQHCALPGGCCVAQLMPPRVTYFCGTQQTCEVDTGAYFGCDGPEDCEEEDVCCGATDTRCTPLNECGGSIVCHTVEDCPAPFSSCGATPLGVINTCR